MVTAIDFGPDKAGQTSEGMSNYSKYFLRSVSLTFEGDLRFWATSSNISWEVLGLFELDILMSFKLKNNLRKPISALRVLLKSGSNSKERKKNLGRAQKIQSNLGQTDKSITFLRKVLKKILFLDTNSRKSLKILERKNIRAKRNK